MHSSSIPGIDANKKERKKEKSIIHAYPDKVQYTSKQNAGYMVHQGGGTESIVQTSQTNCKTYFC